VTFRRTPPGLCRRALWAVAVACAVGGPVAAADPPQSRNYPPTYSSRKGPWYDPFHLFTGSDKKAVVPASAVTLAAPTAGSKPVPNQMVDPPPGSAANPAWKWYGYGTPTPGRNPLAPTGAYAGVPGNWYTASGATPGAVPHGPVGATVPGLVPDPVPVPQVIYGGPTAFAVGDGLALPPVASSAERFAEVDWTPSPSAALKLPTADPLTSGADAAAAPARLKAPVRADEEPTSAPVLGTPVRPTEPSPKTESPDIPVEPATGIVVPPLSAGMSRADRPLTVRAQAPDTDAADLIRQTCGPDVRVMEVSPVGPKRVVLRLAGTRDAALAARDRLARVPDLAGYQIDFELVTPLRP
jgi:hypothetical protein